MTLEQYADLQQFAPYYRAGKLSSEFIASHLGVSARHIRRLLASEKKTSQRIAWNRVSEEVRIYLTELKATHPHYNCQWLAELASDRFETAISRSSVYRILRSADLLQARPVERTTRVRFEAEKTGDLVQMDTTWGYWWRGRKLCLTVLLDDYSRYILIGEIALADTAWHNMRLIRDVVELYGSFKLLYTDNASCFKPIRHNESQYQKHTREEYESDITKACREVGITHLTHKPYQPQSKGKIERVFRFIQERFVSQIKDDWNLAEVNAALEEWVMWYNERHVNRSTGVVPKERFDPKGFRPLSGEKSLEDIFCHKDTRKVDKCNCFSYKGITYQILKEHCLVAFKVELHIVSDLFIRVWHNDQFICQFERPWPNENSTFVSETN